MHINIEVLMSKGVLLEDIYKLQLILQNEKGVMEDILKECLSDSILERFSEKGWTQEIKGLKKDSVYFKLRLSSKGKTLLQDIATPKILDEDIQLFEALKNLYLELGKELGNTKKTKEFIARFREESGISRNRLFHLCKVFTNDERQIEFSIRLEYLFYKPVGHYDIKFQLNQSRLYQYYQNNQEYFMTYWAGDEKFE